MNFSIASHLIHSRMQLIRHRLDPRNCTKDLFQMYYQEYLEKASDSVKRDHGITCDGSDIAGAVDLMIESLRCDNANKYFVVIERDYSKNTTRAVTTTDGGHSISPANPVDRWTHHEAVSVKNDIQAHWRNSKHLYIETRWHLPE